MHESVVGPDRLFAATRYDACNGGEADSRGRGLNSRT
jgi:hypothetical protein